MKLLGLFLLVISGIFTALVLCRREAIKASRASSVLSFAELVKGSVENYSLTADEILKTAGGELLVGCGYPEELSPPEDFCEFSMSCEIPDKETEKLFSEFLQGFGKGCRAEETARCEYYIDKIKKRKDKLYEELPKKKKMILALSAAVSLGLVILMI